MINTIIISSIFLSFLTIYFVSRVFSKKNIVDKINDRSSHNTVAYRIGGISIFISVFLLSVFYYVKGVELYDYSLLIPLAILLLIGFYDDLYEVDFKLKFIFQIIAAKIIIDNGLIVDNMHGILGIYELNRIAAQALTIFIIVAIINSINFIDGIDGLAILIVSLFIISFEFFSMGTTSFRYISLILIASFLPLIYFNTRNDKKVFLGDSGSLFLGGIVSIYVLNILSPSYLIKPEYDINKVFFVISILFYPIIDLVRVFILRIVKGGSPFKADKNHIHHILNIKLKKHWQVSLILTAITILAIILIQIISRK